jgi:hypothetical protein
MDENWIDPEAELTAAFDVDPVAVSATIATQAAQNAVAAYAAQQAQEQARNSSAMGELVARQAYENVSARFRDIEEYQSEIAAVLAETPELVGREMTVDQLEAGLTRAYRLARAQDEADHPSRLFDEIRSQPATRYEDMMDRGLIDIRNSRKAS